MKLSIDLEIPDVPTWDSTAYDAKFCKLQATNYMYLTYAGWGNETNEELNDEHKALTQAFLFLLSRLGAHINE